MCQTLPTGSQEGHGLSAESKAPQSCVTMEQIAEHLAWLRTMDEEYAKWARGNYWAMLSPFLAKSRGH